MRRKNLISCIVLMAVSLAFIEESIKLPFGNLRGPEPGFWPLILASILLIASVVLLMQTLRSKNEQEGPFWARPGSWKRCGMAMGSLFAFGFIFSYLGYLISVSILITFLMKAIEPQKWWLSVAVGVSSALLSYVLFGSLLNTPLPVGKLGI